MVDAPYRQPDDTPRYVCIVCFGTLTLGPGPCPRCGAPLSSLDDLEISTAVRNRAAAERSRLNRNKALIIMVPATIVSLTLYIGLATHGIPVDYLPRGGYGGGFLVPFLFWLFFVVLFGSLYPRLFQQTQARLKFDPVNADLPSVLAWLGLRVEGQKAGR